MKRVKIFSFIAASLLIFFAFSNNPAQSRRESFDSGGGQPPPPYSRPNLLQELNLSNEQIRQIRRLNQDRRAAMIEAQNRLRNANRALDIAIYKEMEDESEIELKMREVQAAQAEVVENRIMTERAIRKVLTPQQLLKFRELRERFSTENNARNGFEPNRHQPQKLRNLPRDLRRRRMGNGPQPQGQQRPSN